MELFLSRVKNIFWNDCIQTNTWYAIEKLLTVATYPFDWVFNRVSPTVGWLVYGVIVGFVAQFFPICYLYGLVVSVFKRKGN